MKMQTAWGIMAATLLAAAGTGRAGNSPGAARAVRAEPPPVLDGKLDDACWQQAPPHGDFTVFRGNGRRATDTVFRLAHDAAWLYLGVDCRHPDMAALQPKVRGHDRGASNDESVELFLDPGTGGAMYLQYMLSFANARDERRVTGVGPTLHRDLQWDVPWRSATQVRADGWSAELALPLHVLASYGPLEKIRLNLARNRREPVIDAQHVVVDERRQASTWAPVIAGFHEQEAFRPLAGLEAARLEVPVLARIAEARVRPYAVRGGRTVYELEARVAGYTRRPAALLLKIEDRPVSGPPAVLERPVALDGPVTLTLTAAVPVASVCTRAVVLTLSDPARGEVLDTLAVEELSALNVMEAFLDRTYYTAEPRAAAHCRIGLPPETLATLRLEARDAAGRVRGSNGAPAAVCRVEIPLEGFPEGRHALTLALRPAAGPDVFAVPLELVRRAPRPGREWKVDRARRVLLNNGTPFFPFGMVMGGVRPDDDAAFRQLAERGFNTFFVWQRGTPEDMVRYQERAAAHGLLVLASPDECATNIVFETTARYTGALLEQVRRVTARPSLIALKNVLTLPIPVAERNAIYGEYYDKNIEGLIGVVRALRDFDNLVGYFILDEPMAATYFDQYRFGQDYYARIHRADGYHPVIVNYSSHIPDGDEYVNWCDVLMTDPYWSPPAAADTRTTPNHVSKITWTTDQRALAHRQPNWQVLAGPLWSGCVKRPLTRRELRCQTYLALIHRATGIFYFCYPWMRTADWEEAAALGAEMKTLAAFILGPAVPGAPAYRKALLDAPGAAPAFADDPFDPPREQYPAVQAAILADAAGAQVLLAANSRHYPVACRFAAPGLAGATALFGGRDPAVADGAFAETLEPYATRAWRLDMAPGSAPGALAVDQAILKADLPNPETLLPFAWRPGRRNVLPNPGFEEALAEEYPDYYRLSPGATRQRDGARFGDHCLKIEYTGGQREQGLYEFVHVFCAPQHETPRTYTFSLYLKGSRDGLKAWIRGTQMNPDTPYGENRTVALSTNWTRYAISGVIPAKSAADGIFELRLIEPGALWADGLQLEAGAEPTEFEE